MKNKTKILILQLFIDLLMIVGMVVQFLCYQLEISTTIINLIGDFMFQILFVVFNIVMVLMIKNID